MRVVCMCPNGWLYEYDLIENMAWLFSYSCFDHDKLSVHYNQYLRSQHAIIWHVKCEKVLQVYKWSKDSVAGVPYQFTTSLCQYLAPMSNSYTVFYQNYYLTKPEHSEFAVLHTSEVKWWSMVYNQHAYIALIVKKLTVENLKCHM